MALLSASPTDAPSQAPKPVTVGVCSCAVVRGPPVVSKLFGYCRLRKLFSFMQQQTINFASRCTILPGDAHMLLCSAAEAPYTDICLLFCRAFSAGHGNPYKLSIVPRSQVKGQEHWSISATGICHIGSDHAAVFVPSGKLKS